MDSAPQTPKGSSIVLYDGDCGLCERGVRFLLKHDKRGRLYYAPLSGTTAAPLLQRHNITLPKQTALQTMYLVIDHGTESERVYPRTSGTLRCLVKIGGLWSCAGIFLIVPPFIRDFFYRVVARLRFAVFGRATGCLVPNEKTRKHLLP